jgi:ATP-dependent protease HslVU (ClpYQ) peptidase subunit
MTTIAALHVPGIGTIIGSDRQITSPARKLELALPKWIISDDGMWAMGASGSFRTLNLMFEHSEAIFHSVDTPLELATRIRSMLKEDGYSFADEPGYPDYDGGFLIASPHGAWDVDSSFSVAPIAPGEVAATGSGGFYAIGAGLALESVADPSERVRRCLEIARHFDPSTGGDLWVTTLPMSARAKKSSSRGNRRVAK